MVASNSAPFAGLPLASELRGFSRGTDFIQGLIMVVGLAVLSLVALAELGGFGGMVLAVNQANPATLVWMGGKTFAAFAGSVVGLLGIGLGYPGQPHVLTRYMAAKDSNVIKKGVWVALGWAPRGTGRTKRPTIAPICKYRSVC